MLSPTLSRLSVQAFSGDETGGVTGEPLGAVYSLGLGCFLAESYSVAATNRQARSFCRQVSNFRSQYDESMENTSSLARDRCGRDFNGPIATDQRRE